MEEVKKEVRYINNVELRASAEPDSREIRGTAIVFNSTSELLGNQTGRQFHETIKPEAISDELIKNSDIMMLYNHDDSHGVLARSKKGIGSLKINKDANGVHFSFKAKRTALGEEVLQSVKEGDLSGASFAMTIDQNGKNDVWSKGADGYYMRTINNISALYDLSIVGSPAYEATQVSTRGLDVLIETEQKEMQKLEAEKKSADEKRIADEKLAEEKRLADLKTYYVELRKTLNL
jgi:HK97 family phage prohead protease